MLFLLVSKIVTTSQNMGWHDGVAVETCACASGSLRFFSARTYKKDNFSATNKKTRENPSVRCASLVELKLFCTGLGPTGTLILEPRFQSRDRFTFSRFRVEFLLVRK